MNMTSRIRPESRNAWLALGLGIYMISTLISMAAMSLGAVIMLVMILWAYQGPQALWVDIRKNLQDKYLSRYVQISVLLMVTFALSLLWAKVFPIGFGGKFIHVYLTPSLAKFWYLFWPLVLSPVLVRVDEQSRLKVLRAWIIAFFILSVIGVIQFFTGWPRPQWIPGFIDGRLRSHATLFLGHHLSVASIFIFPFFTALDFLGNPNKTKEIGFSRLFLGMVVLIGGVTLFLTFSRTLWVALPIGIFVWLVWTLPRRWGVGLTVFSLLSIGIASQHPVIQARFDHGIGISTRQELWKANLEFFKLRPLLGVGWRQNQELSGIYFDYLRPGVEYFQGHAHNNFLDTLAGTGILGTLSWLAWCIASIWILWPSAKRSHGFARGLVCAWLVFHINGLTQLNFWEGKVTHQAVSMVAWSLLWVRKSNES